MLDIVQPKNYDDSNEDETYDEVLPHENYARNRPIIPVSHESNEPIVEWTDNKTLLTGAFPDKFLFGQGVPNGLPTQQNWKHFSLYYNGWFDDPLFIAHGFNQLQRASCIQNLAKITGKNLATLKSLGVLANSEEFWRQLIWARDNWLQFDVKSINLPQCINNSIQASNNDANTNRSNQYEMRRDGLKKFATLSRANTQYNYWQQLTLTL